jgi:deoxycytidine triphosphate deaminase
MDAAVLSDGTIKRLVREGRIRIDPWDEEMVQPASLDLRLGPSFRVFHNHRIQTIDLARPPKDLTEHVTVSSEEEFVIHPGEFVLGGTAEWVQLPDDVVARIEGKALALDTPVPTPTGWKTMGDLEVGDLVFDAKGQPTAIIDATEVLENRECREVEFSDGTTVVADVDHRWAVLTKYERRYRLPPRVRTTREIGQTLKRGAEYQNHVPLAAPVEYSRVGLPIDPYVMGVWLGDGTTAKAEITCADEPILRELELAGYAPQPQRTRRLVYRIGGEGHTRDPESGRYVRNGSLNSRLRDLGLLAGKLIPEKYLRASVAQRQALLEGLMDTDGYVDRLGRCELTTVKPRLAEQYRELIASLGFRPVVAVKTAMLDGRDCGLKYDVTFTPDRPVFRLPRKLARQKRVGKFHRSRGIVDVRPVDSVPVRCIQVASTRGLFLITPSFIPTHNSSLGRLGLIVHATAGFVDPGFEGTLTLEITNFNSVPIVLRPGLPIAQLSFLGLDRPAEVPYGHPSLGSHYHGQVDATESRYEGGRGPRRRSG